MPVDIRRRDRLVFPAARQEIRDGSGGESMVHPFPEVQIRDAEQRLCSGRNTKWIIQAPSLSRQFRLKPP